MLFRSGQLPPQRRGIRSYVIREGRMTPGQQRAFDEAWPQYGLEPEAVGDFLSQCDKAVLEIGFGMGDSLFEQAEANPDVTYIGIEMHRPGCGHLMQRAQKAELLNIRVIRADAVLILKGVPDASLDRVQIFFPDPWPKKRHHKRRLINAELLHLLAAKLHAGGIVHIATDWENYAEWIVDVFQDAASFEQVPPPSRPETKYERRGQRLGHKVADLAYRRI